MGDKKPKASKLPKQNQTVQSENPTLDGNKGQRDLQMNSTLGGETPRQEKKSNSNGLSSSRKRAKNQAVVVRRSRRLRSIFQPVRSNNTEPIIEEIEISDDEEVGMEEGAVEPTTPGEIALEERIDHVSETQNEDQEVNMEEDVVEPTTLGEIALEERIDPVSETQNEDQEALKSSKGPKTSSKKSQGPSRADVHYRSLYFESVKKVESLTEENHQLCMKLENALGKLEVYEKGPSLLTDALNKVNGMILVSNIGQATEAAMKLSAQAIGSCFDASHVAVTAPKTSPAKRKMYKGKGKGKGKAKGKRDIS